MSALQNEPGPRLVFGPAVAARVGVLLTTLVAMLAVYNAIEPGLQYASGGLQVAAFLTAVACLLFFTMPNQKTVTIPVSISNALSTSIPAGLLWAKRLDYRTDALARWAFTFAVLCEIGYVLLAHHRVLSPSLFPQETRKLPRYEYAPYLGGALLVSGLVQLLAAILHVADRGHDQTRAIVLGLAIASAAGHVGTTFAFWNSKQNYTYQIFGSGVAAFAGLALVPLGYEVDDAFLVIASVVHAIFEAVVVGVLHDYE